MLVICMQDHSAVQYVFEQFPVFSHPVIWPSLYIIGKGLASCNKYLMHSHFFSLKLPTYQAWFLDLTRTKDLVLDFWNTSNDACVFYTLSTCPRSVRLHKWTVWNTNLKCSLQDYQNDLMPSSATRSTSNLLSVTSKFFRLLWNCRFLQYLQSLGNICCLSWTTWGQFMINISDVRINKCIFKDYLYAFFGLLVLHKFRFPARAMADSNIVEEDIVLTAEQSKGLHSKDTTSCRTYEVIWQWNVI